MIFHLFMVVYKNMLKKNDVVLLGKDQLRIVHVIVLIDLYGF
jgi:hypothetical protein